MIRWLCAGLVCCALALPGAAPAGDFDYALQARNVAPDAYAFIGRDEDFDTLNGGNIVNTGFIVGRDGIVVIDSGPSLRYGRQMREVIASVSALPVVLLINTHHHPDHFLGNQAFADRPIGALPGTVQAIASDGDAFAENLYRLCGDWMKGTEPLLPTTTLRAGRLDVAGRSLRLIALAGHTGADLAVYDETSGVLFAGDLVFNGRAPTTPHADIDVWFKALDELEALSDSPGFVALVPGHGAISRDASPIRQTRAWLSWLQASLREAAEAGLDMNEVLTRALPAAFVALPVAASEYRRSVGHLFPAAEKQALDHAH